MAPVVLNLNLVLAAQSAMALSLGNVLVICLLCHCNSLPLSRPSNGLQECWKTTKTPALGVLPGGGWDNLQNLDMGRVMNITYGHCQTTEDGFYLIPDEVFVIPKKLSIVGMNSEIISSWEKDQTSTARSINADVSYLAILNAKFSIDHQRMKTHQVEGSSVTSRTEVRYHLYTVKAYPDFTLDFRFAREAEEIADAFENNQTRQATYLSEKLVRNYGTHVITTVKAGALLVKEDYLRHSYVEKAEHQSSVSALAAESFFGLFGLKGSASYEQDTAEGRWYKENTTYSFTQSYGGALFYPGLTLKEWQEGTRNNLVAIDRDGVPLQFVLTTASFPHLPEPIVHRMATEVRRAVERYYKINRNPGCIKPDSKNFNFQANEDDGSCDGPETQHSFGGVYQQCTQLTPDADPICKSQAQLNPDTGDYSCRAPFKAVLLQSEVVEQGYSEYECRYEKKGWWSISKKVCENVYHVRKAHIETFWCYGVNVTEEFSGYLFGGLYSLLKQNPITKSMSCPPTYLALKLLSSGLMVCLSNVYEGGARYSVPFGGFFSCKSGNPLSGGHRCPPQFSQQHAAISDGCQVLYCVQSDVFKADSLLRIHLPPFTRPPLVEMLATDTLAVMTEGDKVWIREGETKKWRAATHEDIRTLSEDPDPSTTSGWQIFGIIMACAVSIFIVKEIVLLVRSSNRQRVGTAGSVPRAQFRNTSQTSNCEETYDEQCGSVRMSLP
ncbi:macrophage-expressed gene 1 protein-like [Sardina pilchardus]|uniref:macrophage-expressed gene 1 protein-like n=1 Tax=Sardina pilchardus TaxID=27697 RepID=UPI002E136352